jgi:hypothetical protein
VTNYAPTRSFAPRELKDICLRELTASQCFLKTHKKVLCPRDDSTLGSRRDISLLQSNQTRRACLSCQKHCSFTSTFCQGSAKPIDFRFFTDGLTPVYKTQSQRHSSGYPLPDTLGRSRIVSGLRLWTIDLTRISRWVVMCHCD